MKTREEFRAHIESVMVEFHLSTEPYVYHGPPKPPIAIHLDAHRRAILNYVPEPRFGSTGWPLPPIQGVLAGSGYKLW